MSVLFLHPKQAEVFNSKARFKVVVAGRRWGKSQLSKISIMRAARRPNLLIWYVAPSYRMCKQIMWLEIQSAIPKKWIKKINETNLSITLINNTRIELKGADNPDSLRGVGVDFLVMDEVQDISADAWKLVLRPTLASTGGHGLFIGTPKAYNLLYELYMLGQDFKNVVAHKWESWQFPTITSPFIPEEEIEAARHDMDEKSFAQEFLASFEVMSGRVYHAFERKRNVKRCAFNPKLPIWVGQDFNLSPMSSVILQPQPNGEVWAVDEIVLTSSNTEEVASELERKYWRTKGNVTIYPDPNGASKQHARGESDLDIFREHGFTKIKHRKRTPWIADRVNSVNRLCCSADGTVRFYADPKCKHLINSLEQTIYKDGTREVDKKGDCEHSADALGYPLELEFPSKKIEIIGVSL